MRRTTALTLIQKAGDILQTNPQQSLRLCKQVVAAFEPEPAHTDLLYKAHVTAGKCCHYQLQDMEKSVHHVECALALAAGYDGAAHEDIYFMYTIGIIDCSMLGRFAQALEYCTLVVDMALQLNNTEELSRGYLHTGAVLTRMQETEKALDYYQKCLAVAESNAHQNLYANALYNIADRLDVLGEYTSALSYFKQVLAIATDARDNFRMANVSAMLSFTYTNLNQFRNALDCAGKAQVTAKAIKNTVIESMALRAKGYAYRSANKQVRALDCLLESLKLSLEKKYYPDAIATMSDVAGCLVQLKKFTQAGRHLDDARKLAEKHNIHVPELWLMIYEGYYNLYKTLNSTHEAYTALQQLYTHHKRIAHDEREVKSRNALILYNVEKLERDKESERIRADYLQGVAHKQNQELVSLSLQLAQKNKTLRDIQLQLRELLETDKDRIPEAAAGRIISESTQTSFDDAYWQSFNQNFNNQHPQFNKALLELCPGLSPGELKVCSLLRLQLSTKEIAYVLKVSLKTIGNHRDNIRKKLQLTGRENLVSFLSML